MTFWTPDNLRQATGGSWVTRPPLIELPKDRPADLPLPQLHAPILGVSTDTRTLKPGMVFIALRGENFDGHEFLAAAAKAGSPIIIVDDASKVPAGGFDPPCGVLKVSDTGKALLKIAGAYRQTLTRTKVIAVCGSNGKTTTTRLIDQVLGRFMRGSASQKSFNNSVGVPLTILGAKESDQYLVCEVGTNHPGEIALLGDVVRPDIAVVTSIGREHLEGLGSLQGVAAEEAAMLKFVKATGWVVATSDAPELREHLRNVKNLITFGTSPEATFRLSGVQHVISSKGLAGGAELAFVINGRKPVRLSMVGEHNAHNALAALGVARRLGIDEDKAIAALASASGADMRLAIVTIAGVTVINDAYNANPDSMLAGIRTLRALASAGLASAGSAKASRRVLVLGEMLELGSASGECHAVIGREVAELSRGGEIDLVVLVGQGMQAAEEILKASGLGADRLIFVGATATGTDAAQAARIASLLAPGDLVLIKGSRRVKLERVLEVLKSREQNSIGQESSASVAVGKSQQTLEVAGPA